MINNVFGISSAALSTGILLGTFLIAVFSSFSLYFTSIYSKLDDLKIKREI